MNLIRHRTRSFFCVALTFSNFADRRLDARPDCRLSSRRRAPVMAAPRSRADLRRAVRPSRYAAIGASDVSGIGSSVVCVLQSDCPNGTGYVFVAARGLRGRGFTVNVTNLGLPTGVISRSFQDLGSQTAASSLATSSIRRSRLYPKDTTLITIFAGANEVNIITSALGAALAATIRPATSTSRSGRSGRLQTLMTALRAVARRSARFVILNVPNVAGMPFLAGAARPAPGGAARLGPHDDDGHQRLRLVECRGCRSDVRLAPVRPSNYSSDGFHPNDAGYAVIGNEIVRAVTERSYAAPQAAARRCRSCPEIPGGGRGARVTLCPRVDAQPLRRVPRTLSTRTCCVTSSREARSKPRCSNPCRGRAQRRLAPRPLRTWPAGFHPGDRPPCGGPAAALSHRRRRAHRPDRSRRHARPARRSGFAAGRGRRARRNFEQAALREAHEEIGLRHRGTCATLGALTPHRHSRQRLPPASDCRRHGRAAGRCTPPTARSRAFSRSRSTS